MRHKYYLLTLLVCFIGIVVMGSCHDDIKVNKKGTGEVKINLDSIVHSDSINLTKSGFKISNIQTNIEPKRYFLISYTTQKKSGGGIWCGNLSFGATNFPSKLDIDSIVYSDLPYKKSCLQGIIIVSIFEFKNELDYNNYSINFQSSGTSKHKKGCQ